MILKSNGFFSAPFTTTDWAVLTVAISSLIFRILILYQVEDKVTIRDILSVIVVGFLSSFGLYEAAIARGWDIGLFFIPYSIMLVIAKDISDWLFMEEEGRKYVIETMKVIINRFLKIDKDGV